MQNLFKSLVLLAIVVASANASATLVEDYINLYEDNGDKYVYLSAGHSYTVTHDLTDEGVPFDYFVDNAWLNLSFSDDFGWETLDLSWWDNEVAIAHGEGIFDVFEVDGTIFSYEIEHVNIFDAGVAALNSVGQLQVTITSIFGDFYWKESTLFAEISPVSVNEPTTLILLGIGIIGLGLARRRKPQ